jgi:hypothetical protein
VFAAIPFGIVGALATLWLVGSPFGFMAFLGIASLIGVIVSHIIVLFDFIEEMHERGEPPEDALLDAGIVRLRPVLITVAATVVALFPLAAHGGPLWEPMCYAQIGGLTAATFVTLLVVPVLYAIFVLDLKLVKWDVRTTRPLRWTSVQPALAQPPCNQADWPGRCGRRTARPFGPLRQVSLPPGRECQPGFDNRRGHLR